MSRRESWTGLGVSIMHIVPRRAAEASRRATEFLHLESATFCCRCNKRLHARARLLLATRGQASCAAEASRTADCVRLRPAVPRLLSCTAVEVSHASILRLRKVNAYGRAALPENPGALAPRCGARRRSRMVKLRRAAGFSRAAVGSATDPPLPLFTSRPRGGDPTNAGRQPARERGGSTSFSPRHRVLRKLRRIHRVETTDRIRSRRRPVRRR